MLSEKVINLLNVQIEKELYSAYLYLGISNFYGEVGLTGFANWFFVQAQEELDHALLFRTYLMNNNQSITLLPLDAPASQYDNYEMPLHEALKHEEYVTGLIHTIFEAASEDHDYRTQEFLNWFIKEQGEEEKNITDLITKYHLFGTDAKGLYQLDQELTARTYSPPSLVI